MIGWFYLVAFTILTSLSCSTCAVWIWFSEWPTIGLILSLFSLFSALCLLYRKNPAQHGTQSNLGKSKF